jgi:hypothetical protein
MTLYQFTADHPAIAVVIMIFLAGGFVEMVRVVTK